MGKASWRGAWQRGALLFEVRRATLAAMTKQASKSEQLAVRVEPALRRGLRRPRRRIAGR